MTYKLARKLIDARRERVASLRLRGFTEREIVAALEQQGFFNPETHRPYSTGCIAKDILALQKQWRENAARAISEHKSEQLAEIAEVKRSAWAAKKPDTVIKALQLEVQILGTDAPIRVESKSDASDELLSVVERLDAFRSFYEQLPDEVTRSGSEG
jgi:hypothetical protein